jgi:hypothetical protein
MTIYEDEDPMGVASSIFAKEIADGSVTMAPQKPKQKPVCDHCGSDSVTVDANAEWCSTTNDWVISCTFDSASCGQCEGECSIDWVSVQECDVCHWHVSEKEMGVDACKECESVTAEGYEQIT